MSGVSETNSSEGDVGASAECFGESFFQGPERAVTIALLRAREAAKLTDF
jgi:hypothetical protein